MQKKKFKILLRYLNLNLSQGIRLRVNKFNLVRQFDLVAESPVPGRYLVVSESGQTFSANDKEAYEWMDQTHISISSGENRFQPKI